MVADETTGFATLTPSLTDPLADKATRGRLSPALLRDFEKLIGELGLSREQAARMIGLESPRILAGWLEAAESRRGFDPGPDTMTRLSLILGTATALGEAFGPSQIRVWLERADPDGPFGGVSPLAYMQNATIPGLEMVRRLAEATKWR